MKTTIFLAIFCLLWINVNAQAPQAVKYQAVARDASGNMLANKSVFFKIIILSGSPTGTVVYRENHTGLTTNSFGLVDLEIGKGTPDLGFFSAISWGSGDYFIKVEIFPSGATAWQEMGTTQLLSVPYALYAKDVQNNNDADASPTNEIQKLSISGTVLTLDNGGGSVTLPTSGTGGDNWGTQVVKTNTTLTGQGTDASPLAVANAEIQPDWTKVQNKPAGFADGVDNVDDADADATNEIQVLSKSGNVVSLSKGGGSFTDVVDDADASPTNEIQTLSISGTQLTLSKDGGTVTLPSSGGGDNWGTQVVKTNVTLTGQGTDVSPLGVVNTEIQPEWSKIQNKPASFADGIDNVDDADADPINEIQTLSISGTQLTLSKDGGTVTLPSSGGGDNWGTQTVVTDATFTGNGTTAVPLKIAQQSATSGQALKWNGTTWAPAADETGSGGSNPTGPAGGDLAGTYPNPSIGDGKVTSAKILDGTVANTDLGDNSVTTAKITDGAIANADIADNAINGLKIADASIATADLANSSVTTDKLGNLAVVTDKIGDASVTAPKLASMGATNGQVLKWAGTAWTPSLDLTGSSYWQQNGDNIFFNTGKVGIGKDPGTDNRQFQAVSGINIAIAGENNSSNPALYLKNSGSGAAAEFRNTSGPVAVFRNNLIIQDGTQGNGKVLTSDPNGVTSWQTPATGDNWGTQTTITDATLTGNGTIATPLKIAQQSASTGQALKWNGTTWAPASDETGFGLTLPYEGSAESSGSCFYVTNSGSGFGIRAITNSIGIGAGVLGQATSATGLADGVQGYTNSVNGNGVFGQASATSGINMGVYGISNSTEGYGVYGRTYASSGINYGVYGESASVIGYGVYGKSAATGVYGQTSSPDGKGVHGVATVGASTGVYGVGNGAGSSCGVKGESNSQYGTGVCGKSSATTGPTYGVNGSANSSSGYGVYGYAPKYGVYGESTGSTGRAVMGEASGTSSIGVYGKAIASSSTGVWGEGANQGIYGISELTTGKGVYGYASSTTGINYGLYGQSASSMGRGVYGYASATGGTNYGLYAQTDSNAGIAMYGYCPSSTGTTIGVAGSVISPDGYSGYFFGDKFYVSGDVGIGTSAPTAKLDVNGVARIRGLMTGVVSTTVYRTSDGTLITGSSDIRLKENIEPLQNCLEKVMRLNGVIFSWKADPNKKRSIGFIAQEFEKVIPELVFTNEVDGYKGINYAEVSAILVEAIKEVKAENDRLKAENNQLRERDELIFSRLDRLEKIVGTGAMK